MTYLAGFDVSLLTASIDFDAGAESTATVDVDALTATAGNGDAGSSLFCHYADDGLGDIDAPDAAETSILGAYSAGTFAAALQAEILVQTAAWVDKDFVVSFNNITGLYTIKKQDDIGDFDMTFSGDAGPLLGFSGNVSGAATYTSDVLPTYVIVPDIDKVSDPTPLYEPSGIASMGIADGGQRFGLTRTAVPLYQEYEQGFVAMEVAERPSALAAAPWTFQHLFEHCRTVFPFVIIDPLGDGADYVYYLRDDGASWVPKRASPANGAQFHIPFKTHVVGRAS